MARSAPKVITLAQREESLEGKRQHVCRLISVAQLWERVGAAGAGVQHFPSLRGMVCPPGSPRHAAMAGNLGRFLQNASVLRDNLFSLGLPDNQWRVLYRACNALVEDAFALHARFMRIGCPEPEPSVAAGRTHNAPTDNGSARNVPNGQAAYGQTQPGHQSVSQTGGTHTTQWEASGPSHTPHPAAAPTANGAQPNGRTALDAQPERLREPVLGEALTEEEVDQLMGDPYVQALIASAPGVSPSELPSIPSEPSGSLSAVAPSPGPTLPLPQLHSSAASHLAARPQPPLPPSGRKRKDAPPPGPEVQAQELARRSSRPRVVSRSLSTPAVVQAPAQPLAQGHVPSQAPHRVQGHVPGLAQAYVPPHIRARFPENALLVYAAPPLPGPLPAPLSAPATAYGPTPYHPVVPFQPMPSYPFQPAFVYHPENNPAPYPPPPPPRAPMAGDSADCPIVVDTPETATFPLVSEPVPVPAEQPQAPVQAEPREVNMEEAHSDVVGPAQVPTSADTSAPPDAPCTPPPPPRTNPSTPSYMTRFQVPPAAVGVGGSPGYRPIRGTPQSHPEPKYWSPKGKKKETPEKCRSAKESPPKRPRRDGAGNVGAAEAGGASRPTTADLTGATPTGRGTATSVPTANRATLGRSAQMSTTASPLPDFTRPPLPAIQQGPSALAVHEPPSAYGTLPLGYPSIPGQADSLPGSATSGAPDTSSSAPLHPSSLVAPPPRAIGAAPRILSPRPRHHSHDDLPARLERSVPSSPGSPPAPPLPQRSAPAVLPHPEVPAAYDTTQGFPFPQMPQVIPQQMPQQLPQHMPQPQVAPPPQPQPPAGGHVPRRAPMDEVNININISRPLPPLPLTPVLHPQTPHTQAQQGQYPHPHPHTQTYVQQYAVGPAPHTGHLGHAGQHYPTGTPPAQAPCGYPGQRAVSAHPTLLPGSAPRRRTPRAAPASPSPADAAAAAAARQAALVPHAMAAQARADALAMAHTQDRAIARAQAQQPSHGQMHAPAPGHQSWPQAYPQATHLAPYHAPYHAPFPAPYNAHAAHAAHAAQPARPLPPLPIQPALHPGWTPGAPGTPDAQLLTPYFHWPTAGTGPSVQVAEGVVWAGMGPPGQGQVQWQGEGAGQSQSGP